jgi:hypothetical protein
VPPAVWDARDAQVVRTYLDRALNGEHSDTGGLVWALGHREIAAWAAGRFAQRHRFAAGPSRAAGDPVGRPYQASSDPAQLVPGLGPAAGAASSSRPRPCSGSGTSWPLPPWRRATPRHRR